MLYAGIRGLGHRFVFRNRSGGQHKLPDLVGRDFVREWQGKLLTEDWKNVEILLARFFRTNRNNMLWISPTTGGRWT